MDDELKNKSAKIKVTISRGYEDLVRAVGISITKLYTTPPERINDLDKASISNMALSEILSCGDRLHDEWEYYVTEKNPKLAEQINRVAQRLVGYGFFRQRWTDADTELVFAYCTARDEVYAAEQALLTEDVN